MDEKITSRPLQMSFDQWATLNGGHRGLFSEFGPYLLNCFFNLLQIPVWFIAVKKTLEFCLRESLDFPIKPSFFSLRVKCTISSNLQISKIAPFQSETPFDSRVQIGSRVLLQPNRWFGFQVSKCNSFEILMLKNSSI